MRDIDKWNDSRAKSILCTESRTVSALEAWCAMNDGGQMIIKEQKVEAQRVFYTIKLAWKAKFGMPRGRMTKWENSIIDFALTMGAIGITYDIQLGSIYRLAKTSKGLFKMTMFEAQRHISDGEYWYDKKDNFLNKPSQ